MYVLSHPHPAVNCLFLAQNWHRFGTNCTKLHQIGTKPPILDFIAFASYSVVMSIDDHPARANHAHNQKAERIAKKAGEKLIGGWVSDAEKSVKEVQAGKDYPVEDFENAEGIASVLELKIQEARVNFELTLKAVKTAQKGLKDRYEKEQEHQLKFATGISEATDRINDLYIEIDKIIPIPDYSAKFERADDQYKFGYYLLEDLGQGKDIKVWDEAHGEFNNRVLDQLNSLSYEQTAMLVQRQAELKEALEQKETIENWFERRQENNPKELARKEGELRDALFASGLALQELEKVAAMRSAETKQAIALRNPAIEAEPEEKREANRIAKAAMATAYNRGANDEQAFEIWESTFVSELRKDEPVEEINPHDLFEDEEKKAAIAERDRLAKELMLLKQDNEVKTQRLKVYGEYAVEKANANPATVVAERKAWVELLPHPKDKLHFIKAKEFLNKRRPQGLTEIYLHDTDWKGHRSTHVRRALALRGGVLVEGNKLEIVVGEPREINKFECVFDCGTKVVLALEESHEIPTKIKIGTVFHHDPRWTRDYENNEALHGVPYGIAGQASLEPEQLIPYHNTLKANLHRAR